MTNKPGFVITAAFLNFVLVIFIIFLSLELVSMKENMQELESIIKKNNSGLIKEFYKPVDFSVDFFGMKYQGNSANIIDNHVLYYGAYEKDILFLMRDIIKSMDTQDSVFVDVGANNGHHSLFMSKYAKTVHAFEPYQRVLDIFDSMIEINNIENIIIHPIGLGEKEEIITYYEPPDSNLGTGTFVNSYLSDGRSSEEFKITTGDSALYEYGINNIDIIKIDIEGYEKAALKGLNKTLQASRPFVFFEISIDPEVDSFFKSMEEIKEVFPERYGFINFVKEIENRISGRYQLLKFHHNFTTDTLEQYDLVAFPLEKLESVPGYIK